MSQLHIGIFGPSLSGKTTLAKHLSENLFAGHKIESLVLDPIGDDWGKHSKVFIPDGEEEEREMVEKDFWDEVWSSNRKLVIVDEGTETINNDRKLIPAFTRIRHRGHKLMVIGHRGTTLLPIMRDQISSLYLFRQSNKAAEIWVEQFSDDRIEQATKLNQYEFLMCVLYGGPGGSNLIVKRKLKIE